MKKLLLGAVLVMALTFVISSNAFAGIDMEVIGKVRYIQVYKDGTNQPCDLFITFTSNNQTYTMPATALGTQLNLALVSAFRISKPVSLKLHVILSPMSVEVMAVDFGTK